MDISNWKEIKMVDLFEVKQESKDNLIGVLGDGDIPLVSAGKNNNGVCKRIDVAVKDSTLFPKYTITLDMFGKAHLQMEDFYAVSHGRVNMLIPKHEEMKNKYVGLFLATIISKHFGSFSSYERMCGQGVVMRESILIPVTEDGMPDWKFMYDYIEEIETDANEKVSKYTNPDGMYMIDISSWKPFVIGGKHGMFKLKRGKSKKTLSEPGDIPYVSASKERNAVSAWLAKDEFVEEGNKITVNNNGSVGEAFYQPKPFMACCDVTILEINGENFPDVILDEDLAMFLCTVIKEKGKAYHWGEKWGINQMQKDELLLPVDCNDTPDWNYMRSFIQNVKTMFN